MFVSVELTEAAGSLQDLAPGLLRAERDGVRLTVRVWERVYRSDGRNYWTDLCERELPASSRPRGTNTETEKQNNLIIAH